MLKSCGVKTVSLCFEFAFINLHGIINSLTSFSVYSECMHEWMTLTSFCLHQWLPPCWRYTCV